MNRGRDSDQVRILARLVNIVNASLRVHRIPAQAIGVQTDAYQRVIIDITLDGVDGIARELRRMTGASGCLVRVQVGLMPPLGGWR